MELKFNRATLFWLISLVVLVGCNQTEFDVPRQEDSLSIPTEERSEQSDQEYDESHPVILLEDDRSSTLKALTSSWATDWTQHTINYDEILSGGPPRDGIPSIDQPKFVDYADANLWLMDTEPVIALEIDNHARAYPLQILMWHEIVNDELGGIPVLVTYCPLCNSALVFDRTVNGTVYEFGTSGLLRNSDLIMYDRTTESLWQQFTGEGIVGEHAGDRLTFLPASIISFADFKAAYPQGHVLSRETGFNRDYGTNPYTGYDDSTQPFLFTGPLDDRLPAMMRVVGLIVDDTAVAYPYSALSENGTLTDTINGTTIVIFYLPGTNSALDTGQISEGRDVGAAGVFDPSLGGQVFTFRQEEGKIIDDQTGSTWNIAGQAIEGELRGQTLMPVVHSDHFWFSWAAFYPDTQIYGTP
jgi:hypothetical protein